MSNYDEVEKSYKILKKFLKNKFVLMQCTGSYPAPLKDANLKVIQSFKDKFKCLVGYSDHVMDDAAIIAALGVGISVYEKHITVSKNLPGPDHRASLEKKEFKQLVKKIRNVEAALGDGKKRIENNEKLSSIVQRRSIRLNRSLKKGTKIQEKFLIYLRPCPKNGLSPYEKNKILGKKLKRNLEKEEIVNCQNTI